MAKDEEIILGSGNTYVLEFTGEIPETSTIRAPENLIGATSSGAELNYKPTYTEAQSDDGVYSVTKITKEEVSFKTGVMTINGNKMAQMCSTARVTDDSETGLRTVKIGGIKNDDNKKYLVHFVTYDETISITIVGKNQNGFTLSFKKDAETVIDLEFKAVSMDKDGTKVIYTEKYEVD